MRRLIAFEKGVELGNSLFIHSEATQARIRSRSSPIGSG